MKAVKLQKLIWMLELALEVARQGLVELTLDEEHEPKINFEIKREIVRGIAKKPRPYIKKHKGNDGIKHECCGSRGNSHLKSCENSSRNNVKHPITRNLFKAPKPKRDPLNGKILENQAMKCSTCEEEFVWSGPLLDANCSSCGSSAVAPINE